MLSVASTDVWQWTPFVYLVLFAGLQTVPHEIVEAAQVDGATSWTQFWHIELPYLRPLFVLILFFRRADVIRAFDSIFILTGGGPGATTQLHAAHNSASRSGGKETSANAPLSTQTKSQYAISSYPPQSRSGI
jgi:ABC-type sugar transport system permease subunit